MSIAKNNIVNMDTKLRSGQSLIEAIAALGILTVGLMGVLGLLSRSFLLQREAADRAKATYLASEGLEIAKSLIDHNVYTGVAQGEESNGWSGSTGGGTLAGCFDFSAGGTNYYYLDFETYNCPSSQGSSSVPPDPLYYYAPNPATGQGMYYDSADGTRIQGAVKTDFSRVVEISRPDANTINVISTVTWNTGAITGQSITVEDTFYNWHP